MVHTEETVSSDSGAGTRREEIPDFGDRYIVEKEIGRGGMGRVFVARDRKLGREVAIKVLSPGAHGEDGLRRFEQEARAAGGLHHPNILTVYDIGTSQGMPYIVSEFLRGATLRQRLPIERGQSLDYAVQLARGLSAAHEHGVIHRDLKPENLFITEEGQVKILDFGIAKLTRPPVDTVEGLSRPRKTETGTIIGTVDYMSPEQVRGEHVDHRSDIFSAGALLYEMVAGRQAFARQSPIETGSAILRDDPAALAGELPPEIDRVVRRCLEKEPDRRYQSARDLALDLQALLARAPAPRPRRWQAALAAVALLTAALAALLVARPQRGPAHVSLAAADFVNETSDPDLNGLSGMLITSLEQSKRMSVLTRSRMFDVLKQLGRGDAERIDEMLGREICKQARVDALVLASIRRFGELYVIDFKVLDPVRNEYLYTANEQGKGKESIPAMIDRLSERTRAGLKEKAEEIRATAVPLAQNTTANLEAYQHYFQGEQLFARNRSLESQVEFHKAIELDPGFGLAHFALSRTYAWNHDQPRANEEMETARRLGLPERQRCVAEQPIADCAARFPDDKSILYAVASEQQDPALAAPYLEKIVALDPTFQLAVGDLIEARQALGRADQALGLATDYAARVHDVDSLVQVATAQLFAGDRSGGLEALREAARLFPQSPKPVFELANAFLFSGEPEKAEAELQPVLEAGGPHQPMRAKLDVYRGRFASAAAAYEAMNQPFWKGWVLAAGARDLAAAARIGAELEARGKSAEWPFRLYLVMRDVDRAAALASAGRLGNLRDLMPFLEAQRAYQQGNLAEAIARYEKLAQWLEHGDAPRYWLVELYLEAGDANKALAAAQRIQSTYRSGWSTIFFAMWFPRSFYLMGKAYERLGDMPAALQAYRKFLALWKQADPGLQELEDAKARAAALRRLVRE